MRKVIQLTEQDFKQDGYGLYYLTKKKIGEMIIKIKVNLGSRLSGVGKARQNYCNVILNGTVVYDSDCADFQSGIELANQFLRALHRALSAEPCDKKQTNREYLNSLSDEDFAEQMDFQCMGQCEFAVGWKCIPDRDDYSDSKKCIVGRTRWLQAERDE